MILIQLFLIVGFLIFLYFVLNNPMSYQVRAWTKILAIIFVIAAVLCVLFPNSTNTIEHFFGVSRGADLLLYLLTLAFIFTMFTSYLQEKRLQRRLINLARKVAIIESNQFSNNINKMKKDGNKITN